MDITNNKGILYTLITNLIWGFGFVATIWSLNSYNYFEVFFFRFFISGILGCILIFLNKAYILNYQLLKKALFPSVFLSLEVFFQAIALKYMQASEGGFLFITYVLFTPLLSVLILKKKFQYKIIIPLIPIFIGAYLISQNNNFSNLKGTSCMLLSSAFASLHMIVIEKILKQEPNLSSFWFNIYQLIIGMFLAFFFTLGKITFNIFDASPISIFGILFLSIVSMIFAYYLQIKAQKTISVNIVGILYTIEGIFTYVFSIMLLNEKLTSIQLSGAFLILLTTFYVTIYSKHFE